MWLDSHETCFHYTLVHTSYKTAYTSPVAVRLYECTARYHTFSIFHVSHSLFGWLVADGWCWFVVREEYCWLVAGGWFVLREKYCWLVADKPSEQAH
jgi:hypothetical protein